MSAFSKILESKRPINDEGWIEYAILKAWEELPDSAEFITDNAAAELAALRERVEALETVGRRMLNSLPVSEIEIAREALGNTNTRIILVARDELATALKGE